MKTLTTITTLLVLVLTGQALARENDEPAPSKPARFFRLTEKYKEKCRTAYPDERVWNGHKGEHEPQLSFECTLVTSTFSVVDFLMIPTHLVPMSGEPTTDIIAETTQSITSSKNDTSRKEKKEAKDYKKSLLYAVADDAVYFNAGEREASTALSKAFEILRPHFPQEDNHQLAARIVKAHTFVLESLINE